ncbi:MAG: PQQ-dependent dehydrogenase, methanol/ethanol family, partial [Acidiphilium sp. 21-68-69]
TIPSPTEPGGKTWPAGAYKHGGGSPWMTGTYDPKTKEVFWGVGNPGPWLASMRPGHNLYSDSVIAIDPNTGAIKWHYQYTRNDTWDYDGVNTAQLADITVKGKHYHALVEANRNGYFYAINRENGKLIYAVPFVHDISITGIKDGHAVNNPKVQPALDKQIFTCPSFLGGKNWWPGAVDPATNMAYLSTGKQVWQHRTKEPWDGGAMATSGGLVFSGTTDGHLYAFNAKTGKILWKSPYLGSGVIANPISYTLDGKQYVAVWSGWGGVWPLWSGKLGASLAKAPRGGQLHVFALNG